MSSSQPPSTKETRTPMTPGRVVWHELYTPDKDASKRFYSELFGWMVNDSDIGEAKYSMIHAGEQPIGGLMSLDLIPTKGVPPHWMAYISSTDIDKTVANTREAGGNAVVEATDVPPLGRFCVVQDPAGAVVSAWKSYQDEPPAPETPDLGTFCWDQLNSSDPAVAAPFYEQVFGWTTVPFAESTDNWVFNRGDKPAASLMKAPAGSPSHWLSHIHIDNLESKRTLAADLGGTILAEEIPVPGLGKFAIITDNLGAAFALFEGRTGG